jgi:hypothetical protein
MLNLYIALTASPAYHEHLDADVLATQTEGYPAPDALFHHSEISYLSNLVKSFQSHDVRRSHFQPPYHRSFRCVVTVLENSVYQIVTRFLPRHLSLFFSLV